MKRFSLLAMFLVSALPVAGQTVSATTGAINGRAADSTGAVLPGVTVTIASLSLMGTRSAVTNEEGLFRFPAVPPGDYNVTFELTGFTTIAREGIRVGLGFTATVNADMTIASVQETLTVQGQSPAVDTAAPKVTAVFDAEKVRNLPGNREYWALLSATPAVAMQRIDVGGNQAMKTMGLTVYGTNDQHRPVVEGIVSTWGTSLMYYADLGSFDEVAFNPVGNTAEAPTPGVQSLFISKSGGNKYHGSMFMAFQDLSFQTRNIDADQISRGVTGGGGIAAEDRNRISLYRDVGFDVGGYLRKDKVWWYYSYRNLFSDVRFVNLLEATQKTTTPSHTTKVTYNAANSVRLIGYFNHTDKLHRPAFSAFRLSSATGIFGPGTGWDWHYPTMVYKGEYNQTLGNVAYIELIGGSFSNLWVNNSYTPQLRFEDIGNGLISGGNNFYDETRYRPQGLGSLSYFKDGWKGTHNFKAGFELLWDKETDIDGGFPSNRLHVLRNGAPLEVYLFESPGTVKHNMRSSSGYLVDTWRYNNRLTLNLGVRFDRYRSFLPEQQHTGTLFSPGTVQFPEVPNLVTWNNWAPRLGGTFDLSGRGKTVVKFNVGSYWWTPATDLARSLNPNQRFWYRRYAWTDLNLNSVWDPGEEGRLLETSGGVASQAIDPTLKDIYTLEGMTFLEHELAPDFGVRTGFVWRGDRNLRRALNLNQPFEAFTVPVTLRVPGPDGVLRDDGSTVNTWNLSPQYLGLPTVNLTKNFPEAKNDFYTWEISGNKRMSHGWSMMTGFSHTWNNKSIIPINPNELINRPGGREAFTTWTAKVSGTFELPLDIRVTPLLRHQAGQAFGRLFVASLNYGNPSLLAEPVSAERTRNVTVLDLRIEKAVRVVGRRLAPFFDAYNIANANPETSVGMTSGGSFLRPLDIIPPRVARVGVKLEW